MKGLTSAEGVGEVRHELRTPLNLIIGYCELLLEDATEPSQQAGLERALRGAATSSTGSPARSHPHGAR